MKCLNSQCKNHDQDLKTTPVYNSGMEIGSLMGIWTQKCPGCKKVMWSYDNEVTMGIWTEGPCDKEDNEGMVLNELSREFLDY